MDLKWVMRQKAMRGERRFEHTADVSEAHRQVPVDPGDWHVPGCQIQNEDAYGDTVATFGVASASCC